MILRNSKIADLTGAGDMLLKIEILVADDAQEKGRDRLFWLCLEVMRIISVLSEFS